VIGFAHRDPLELARGTPLAVEEAHPAAEERWRDVQNDLVEQASLETLPGEAPAEDPHVLFAGGGRAAATASSIPAETKLILGSPASSGGLCVITITEPWNAP
jgi:hypothetical protein